VAPAEGVRTSDTGGRVLEAAGRVAWIAAALSAMVLLWSLSRHQPGWAMAIVVCGLAVLSAARPFDGLLVLAGFGPVVTIFSVLLDVDNFGVHYPEALALAFISGAAARRAHERHAFAVPPSVVGPALVLLTAAVASAFTQVPVLSLEQPGLRIPGVPVTLATDYLVLQNRVTAAIGFAAGVVLFLLAADICGRNAERRDRVLVMMVAGAAGAGLLNVVRLVTAAMRREHAAAALWTYAMQSRINVQYPDWNAAGSHFAMMLVVTLALALTARRRSYLVPLILIGAGLWLTGSRTAMAAVLVAAVGMIILRQGPGRQRTIVALCAVATIAAVALAGWWWYPATRNDPAAFSLRTRLILWEAGIRMARDHPLFGVGIGGYWEFSHDYAPAFLDSFWRSHENAHNYFIQLLAELGIPGLMVFVGVIGASLRSAWAPAAAARMSPVWTAGLIAYLLTCLTGHPFLVPDATYPFWIALAVAAGAGGSAAVPVAPRRRWLRAAVAAVIAAFIVTVPLRAREASRHARMEAISAGLSAWQRGADGTRYRWAGAQSTFFYSSASGGIRIPVRAGPDAPPAMDVRIFFDGQEADRVRLHAGEGWRDLRLLRRRQGGDNDYIKIDLTATAPGGATPLTTPGGQVLMVGMPSIVWTQ